MIIPVRCKTCGKPISNKYRNFLLEREKILEDSNIKDKDNEIRELFNNIGIYRYCCRNHFNSNVELLPLLTRE
jgi:DNA-directed RNA polymerase subunit N (RpoN/RPB10)